MSRHIRIHVPTAERWATSPGEASTAIKAQAPSQFDARRTAGLIVQPTIALVQPPPLAQTPAAVAGVITSPTTSRRSRMKRVCVALCIAAAVLIVSTAVFAETSSEELSMTQDETSPQKTNATAPAPATPQKVRTAKATAPAPTVSTTNGPPRVDDLLQVELARLARYPTPPVKRLSAAQVDSIEAVPPHLPTNDALSPPALGAIMLAGALGAGVMSYVGNMAANRRRRRQCVVETTSVDVAPRTDDANPIASTPMLPRTPASAPASSTAATPAPHSNVQSQAAANIAYIDQRDWMAALERTYCVNTRSGPLHAIASLPGAREVNEDYACAFELEDQVANDRLHCMLVADGCGGHAGGREASCLAVRAASQTLIQRADLPVEERVRVAFENASTALIEAGKSWPENSLRTTLIVVVATKSAYYCGWIGDGGIDVHRGNGQWEALLKAHKSGAQNLLAASLGPDLVGEPSFAKHARKAGDRLYLGSDGVFEVYTDAAAFWGAWFEPTSTQRPPEACLHELLNACAKHSAFDDNMSVAYLATPASALAPVKETIAGATASQSLTARAA